MTIETKFNINDLVQHKFQRPMKDAPEHALAYEVMEVNTNCCYTTSQVFYECRAIHGYFEEKRDDKFKKTLTLVDFGAGLPKDGKQYIRFREDEVKVCDEKLKQLVLNSEQNPDRSVATEDHSSNAAG